MSIRRIAERSGVSVATVSRVLSNSAKVNPDTRRKVLKTLEKENFQPKRARRRSLTVGVTIPDLRPGRMDGVYTRELVTGLVEAAAGCDSAVKVINMTDMAQIPFRRGAFSDFCKEHGVDCLIHLQAPIQFHSMLEAVADDGIAQVVIEHRFDRPNIGWIDVDNYGSSRDMADYLANLGCREFAVITADRVFPGHFERHRGFVEALAARGIEVPPEWDVERRRVLIDAGVSATLSLLGSRPTMPRVLYYTNVELAMGGLRALRSKRIAIPEQLVVAIFDDSHSSRWLPDWVLYLSQPAYEMGSTAARFLLTCQPGQVLQQMITPELFISPEILESLENKG